MKRFTTDNYSWSIDGLALCMRDNKMKSEIIAINNNKAIVKVDNYEDSMALGAVSDWCISQHRCSWEQYVKSHPNNIQIFFYDFGVKPDNNLSLVGATFTMDKDWKSMKLMCCFTRENKPIAEKLTGSNDITALNKLITIPNFGLEVTPNNNQLFESLKRYKTTEIKVEKKKKEKGSMAGIHLYPFIPEEPKREEKSIWDEDDLLWDASFAARTNGVDEMFDPWLDMM